MNNITFSPIGIIHSPFHDPRGIPIQASGAKGIKGSIQIFEQFSEGLKDMDGFSHFILIYYFHLTKKQALQVRPYMDSEKRGVFATRAPARPNAIGFSVVRLEKIINNIIYLKDIDIVDGTPLLDIKPCVPEFDFREVTRIGWLEKNVQKLGTTKDDGRFIK